ncbi:MAG: rhomboid family intramembrane serine protease [Bacteroides sp.]|nr:rhomboid family intramembrane serine protease [Bacteroides sp.]
MDKKKTSKIAALVISALVFCLALQNVQDWHNVGIYQGCGFVCRLSYPFYHANLLHASLNAWCLLSVIFIYDTSLWRLAFAFASAVSVPSCCMSSIPTVGLSGVVFALFGSISFEVQRKAYYQLWMLAYLAIGFFFPNTNAWVHLYCYMAGLGVALLNKPVKIG